jgi:hypothetical protein
VGFAKDGRITAVDMFLVTNAGLWIERRWRLVRKHRFAALPAAGDALAQRDGGDQYAAAQRTERAGRHAGYRDHGADFGEGRAATGQWTRWRCGA